MTKEIVDNTKITGTFNVTGAVDLDSTLNVDGAATLQTTLNAKGAVDFDSTLNVDGVATFVSAPVIGSFASATHNHSNAAGGGTIPASSVAPADDTAGTFPGPGVYTFMTAIKPSGGINGLVKYTAGSLTIATGAITVTATYNTVDTEAAAATDDLDTINGGVDGAIVILRAANSARDVVIKDGTGNISCPASRTLTHADDIWMGIYTGARWCEISFADNAA